MPRPLCQDELRAVEILLETDCTIADVARQLGITQGQAAHRVQIVRGLRNLGKHARPKPAGARERRCLGCQRAFASRGAHNRLCESCRRRDISPMEP